MSYIRARPSSHFGTFLIFSSNNSDGDFCDSFIVGPIISNCAHRIAAEFNWFVAAIELLRIAHLNFLRKEAVSNEKNSENEQRNKKIFSDELSEA